MGNILIVDNSQDNIDVVTFVLSRDKHNILSAQTGLKALEIANDQVPDVILLDINMPEMDGYEVLNKLKSNPKTTNIPVIFLSAEYKDSESVSKGLSQGAEDYITKPFINNELRARIKVMVRLKQHIDELENKNHELENLNNQLEEKNNQLKEAKRLVEELAITDPLTNIYNRRYFTERMTEEFFLIQRNDHPITFIMCDIDHFKLVNDNYGHPCGDTILIEFTQILSDTVRKHDVVARYGGEEFIIAMINKTSSQALVIAERIRKSVEETEFVHKDLKIHITASFGVACYPEIKLEQVDLDSLLKHADTALYNAKENGRNQVVVFKN